MNVFGISRKGGLLLNALIGIGGGGLMGITKSLRSYEILILGRFVIGVNCGEMLCQSLMSRSQLLTFSVIHQTIILVNSLSFPGLNTSLAPMYVSEIAPLNLRGALGTVNQLAVCVGLLVSQILGIDQLLGSQAGWPILLGK